MAILSDQFPTQSEPETTNRTDAQSVGALTPILDYTLPPKREPRPELYRPQNAGRIALRPDRRLLHEIRLHCLNEGITLTRWFEIAALATIKAKTKHNDSMGAQAPQTNRLTSKEYIKPSLVREVFTFWTEAYNNSREHQTRPWFAKWKDRDDTLADSLADVRPEIIETAILYCLMRISDKQRLVQAFAYFADEIRIQNDEWKDVDPATVTIRLLSLRERCARAFRVPCPTPTPQQTKIMAATAPKLDTRRPHD
jgi:hypothetical protein